MTPADHYQRALDRTSGEALDRLAEAASSRPSTSLFQARHYEYLAGLCAHVRVAHGDWNLERHLVQAFRVTEANFKPVLFTKRVAQLALELETKNSAARRA